jgi:ribonuclease HI
MAIVARAFIEFCPKICNFFLGVSWCNAKIALGYFICLRYNKRPLQDRYQMKQLSLFDRPHKKEEIYNHWKLFIDGAARNNPGPAGAGIHLVKNDRSFKKLGFYLGKKTNNQAEYGALLIGIYFLKQYIDPNDHVDIISDSELLVKQFKGEYKVKHPELKPLHLLAKSLLQDMTYSISHVLREHNKVADAMANKGIDEKKALPADFLTLLKQHELVW